jgi:hypothetical protein
MDLARWNGLAATAFRESTDELTKEDGEKEGLEVGEWEGAGEAGLLWETAAVVKEMEEETEGLSACTEALKVDMKVADAPWPGLMGEDVYSVCSKLNLVLVKLEA